MIVRKLRLERGWSQEQLAEFSGISVRTIQRMERGKRVGLETLKCLAAVFETDVKSLQPETEMSTQDVNTLDTITDNKVHMNKREREAMEYVRDLKSFYANLISYAITIPILVYINLVLYPEVIWVVWTALGWGCGVAFHGLVVYEVLRFRGTTWERRQIEKRLSR
jgi:transcriptional regulator with XRE-family HTH domain